MGDRVTWSWPVCMLGKALANPQKKYFCILGDGEANEGSVWEGIMFLAQHKIKNLMVIIDNNKQESLDLTCIYFYRRFRTKVIWP